MDLEQGKNRHVEVQAFGYGPGLMPEDCSDNPYGFEKIRKHLESPVLVGGRRLSGAEDASGDLEDGDSGFIDIRQDKSTGDIIDLDKVEEGSEGGESEAGRAGMFEFGLPLEKLDA